jgi:hypothetical protein
MMFGSFWKKATSPIDAEPYLSKMGSQVVPALTDLKTPPVVVEGLEIGDAADHVGRPDRPPVEIFGQILAGRGGGVLGRERPGEAHDQDENEGDSERRLDAVFHADLLGCEL